MNFNHAPGIKYQHELIACHHDRRNIMNDKKLSIQHSMFRACRSKKGVNLDTESINIVERPSLMKKANELT